MYVYCFQIQTFNWLFQTQSAITPHCIVTLPNSNGMQLLLCYDNEGVYVNTYGRTSKNMLLQVKITRSQYQNVVNNCFVLLFFFVLVGWNANLSGVHWYGANNGLGQQGNRNKICGIWSSRWCFYAQEGATVKIFVWT